MSTAPKTAEPGSPEARALWRRLRDGSQATDSPEMPDPLLIAAYVDGTVDAAGRDRVETWMATSAEALELVLGARAATGTLPPAPRRLVARASALVAGPAVGAPAPAPGGGVADWLFGLLRPAALAATAAILFAAIVGFELGREAMVTVASARSVEAEDGLGFGAPADGLL
jgi:hypothetical protein